MLDKMKENPILHLECCIEWPSVLNYGCKHGIVVVVCHLKKLECAKFIRSN